MNLDVRSGVILLNKPTGISSNHCLTIIKNILKKNSIRIKLGHFGTLDPFASGLLVLGINKATKISNYLMNYPKTYCATLQLGASTPTLDTESKINEEQAVSFFDYNKINDTLKSFTGASMQQPPIYSALKQNGVPLYKLARAGKAILKPKRQITVYNIKLISYDSNQHQIKFTTCCSKGTYVRVLAADLARKLGTIGYLKALVRTQLGHLSLKNAASLTSLQTVDQIVSSIKTSSFALQSLNFVEIKVNYDLASKLLQGQIINLQDINNAKIISRAMQYAKVYLNLIDATKLLGIAEVIYKNNQASRELAQKQKCLKLKINLCNFIFK